jgi:uncharacterized protein YpuA (DUF1002 family)
MDPNILTLAGVCVTATSGVIVAIVQTAANNQKKVLEAIGDVKKDLNANTRATVATTRSLISGIHEKYKGTKKLPEKTWKNVLDLYEAYKGITIDGHTPNSWCDEIVEEMRKWEKV